MSERKPLLRQVDPWVFYPSAVVCIAFVLWGVLDKGSLGDAADSALGWVIETFGWVFVLSTLGFLALAVYLGAQPAREDPPGPGRRAARVPHVVVGRDDVQRRHGHRAHVLRRHRAALAPRRAAERRRPAEHARGGARRDGVLLLPLGLPPVGDLRDRRPRARLLRLPQGPAEPDQLGVPAAARRSRRRPDRARDRLARDLRDAVRQRHLARPRRAADQRRHGHPLGRRELQRRRRDDHRRAHRRVHPLGRLRRGQGRAVPQQHQHGARRPAAAVPARSPGRRSSSSTR